MVRKIFGKMVRRNFGKMVRRNFGKKKFCGPNKFRSSWFHPVLRNKSRVFIKDHRSYLCCCRVSSRVWHLGGRRSWCASVEALSRSRVRFPRLRAPWRRVPLAPGFWRIARRLPCIPSRSAGFSCHCWCFRKHQQSCASFEKGGDIGSWCFDCAKKKSILGISSARQRCVNVLANVCVFPDYFQQKKGSEPNLHIRSKCVTYTTDIGPDRPSHEDATTHLKTHLTIFLHDCEDFQCSSTSRRALGLSLSIFKANLSPPALDRHSTTFPLIPRPRTLLKE